MRMLLFYILPIAQLLLLLLTGSSAFGTLDTSMSNTITIIVNYEWDDISPSAENCNSDGSEMYCNLRSAWLKCLELAASPYSSSTDLESCIVEIPVSFPTIEFKQENGPLIAPQNASLLNINLAIRGYGSEIVSNGSMESLYGGIPLRSYDGIDTQNFTMTGLYGGLKLTLYCDYCSGDMFLRLYDETGTMIAFSDDYLGLEPALTYTIPGSIDTGMLSYEVEVGCTNIDSTSGCTGTIYQYQMDIPAQRFLFAQTWSIVDVTPSLVIEGLMFTGFGSSIYNGGVLYVSDGAFQLSVNNCTFHNNEAYFGGVLYLNSLASITMTDLMFVNNMAFSGGAVHLDKLVHDVNLVNSIFKGNQASSTGGGVAMYTLNSGINIENCTFDNNDATISGGSIQIYQQNSQLTFKALVINGSHAQYGGGVYVDSNNQHITFEMVDLAWGEATYGGGMYFASYNSFILLNTVIFEQLTAYRAASASFNTFTNNLVVLNCIFTNLTAEYYAGIYITQSTNLLFQNNIFQQNHGTSIVLEGNSDVSFIGNILTEIHSANVGAGFSLPKGNRNVWMQSNTFYNVSSNGPGACIRVYDSNTNVTITDTQFAHCAQVTDEGEGAALEIETNNRMITVLNSVFDNCFGYMAGCINIGSNNTIIQLKNLVMNNPRTTEMAGAMMLGDSNSGITFTNISVYNSQATDGAVMVIISNNVNVTLEDCRFINNTALGYGGSMLITQYNKNIVFRNLVITSNRATYGGGMAIFQGNEHFLFQNITVSNNYAKVHGGGLYFMTLNKFMTLETSNILNNTAEIYGGGVMLNKTNDNFTMAGCTVDSNRAGYGAGLFSGYNNQHMALLDSTSYKHMVVDQFVYNEVVLGVMYDRNISMPNAKGYILSFTFSNYEDTQTIYVYADGILRQKYEYYANFPGLSKPSFYIEGANIRILYISTDAYGTDDYFGFGYMVLPVMDVLNSNQGLTQPNRITNNIASYKGGGMYFYSNGINVFISSTFIESNSATSGGGGLFMQLVQTDSMLVQSVFRGNFADSSGGGLGMLAGCYGIQIIENTIANNIATDNGGGIYFGTTNGQGLYLEGNEVVLEKNNITGNAAKTGYGGGYYCDSENIVISSENQLMNNFAGINGGAFYLNSQNKVTIQREQVENNKVLNMGGGFYSSSQNTITITSTNFTSNQATNVGGAIVLDDQTQAYFQGTNIVAENYAYFGGGIAALSVDLWQVADMAHLWVTKNTASRGSGLFCYPLVSQDKATNSLRNITFQQNEAQTGGTVYWLRGASMMSQPNGLQSSKIDWIDNKAGYGEKWATQATKLHAPTVYEVDIYDANLSPALALTMSDYYNQTMYVSNDTEVFATLMTSSTLQRVANQVAVANIKEPFCDGIPASLSGDNVAGVVVQSGVATFSKLQAYCNPGGNFSVQFEAKLGSTINVPSQLSSALYISSYTLFSFRNCLAGEYTKNGMCITCAKGTYNLESADDIESCTDCTKTEGVDTCYSNQIIVEQGYWRRYPTNTAVMKCLLTSESCVGGNVTGQALCAVGYTGPLCAVCASGYYINENKCQVCSGGGALSTTLVVVICVLCATVVGIAAYYYLFVFNPINNLMESWAYKSFNWIKTKYADMTSSLKIVVATYQIVTSVGSVFSITMPIRFTSFMKTFKVFNVSMSSLFPLGCSPDFDFMDTLFWTTMSPILFIGVIVFVFSGEYYYWYKQIQQDSNRQKGAKRAKFEEIKNKYLNYIFYVTYLILPSVTTTIFQLFICQNIDPNSEDSSSDDYFLTADMTISCSSNYYKSWLVYGGFMIIVYPIGIPMMYLALLYQNREEIESRGKINNTGTPEDKESKTAIVQDEMQAEDSPETQQIKMHDGDNHVSIAVEEDSVTPRNKNKEEDSGESTETGTRSVPTTIAVLATSLMSASALRLQFLWRSYEPQFWYWEVVETFRRIMLTAVISVIKPGTSEQNLVSIIFAVAFMKLYSTYHPYANARNDVLAELGQLQIFFTFLCALTINNDLLVDTYKDAMDSLLLLLNLNVMLFVLYHTVNGIVERNGGWNKVFALLIGLTGSLLVLKTQQQNKASPTESKANQDYDVELTTFSNNPLHEQKTKQQANNENK